MNENEASAAERVYPGGWAKGIGWVAVAGDLDGDDLATDSASEYRTSFNPAAFDPTRPVIVTRWADGTVPSAPVAPEVDGLVTMLERRIADRVLRADHYRTSGRITEAAVVDGAINAYRDVLDRLASGVPSTPQALDERTETLANALRLTVEYVGLDSLPPNAGWSWFDALRTEPWFDAWLEGMTNPPTPDPAPSTPQAPDERCRDLLRATMERAEADGWRPMWFANYVAPLLAAAPSTSDKEAPSDPAFYEADPFGGPPTPRFDPPAAAVPVVPEEPAADWHCEGDAVGIYWEGICSPGNPVHSSPCGPIPPAPVAGVEPQPAPVDVLAMPEVAEAFAALVQALDTSFAEDIAGKAADYVAARSAAGSTEAETDR